MVTYESVSHRFESCWFLYKILPFQNFFFLENIFVVKFENSKHWLVSNTTWIICKSKTIFAACYKDHRGLHLQSLLSIFTINIYSNQKLFHFSFLIIYLQVLKLCNYGLRYYEMKLQTTKPHLYKFTFVTYK